MTITSLQNLYVVARDMDRMKEFYGNALGAVEKFRDGARWAQLKIGGSNFALASIEEAGAGQAGVTPVFTADSLNPAIEAVVRHGGRLLATRDMGSHGKTATCADPEGNVFQILQRAHAP
jgi:predicted enzyme related to lactoylglutathione lyase